MKTLYKILLITLSIFVIGCESEDIEFKNNEDEIVNTAKINKYTGNYKTEFEYPIGTPIQNYTGRVTFDTQKKEFEFSNFLNKNENVIAKIENNIIKLNNSQEHIYTTIKSEFDTVNIVIRLKIHIVTTTNQNTTKNMSECVMRKLSN